MKKYHKYIYSLLALLLIMHCSRCMGQGYMEIDGPLTIAPGQGASVLSRELYIGPHASITVTGEWRIASERIYISPTATISGTGTIILDRPAIYTIGASALSWTRQSIDGGGAPISCHIVLRNPAGASLVTISPAAILGYPSDTVATLLLNDKLTFADSMRGNNLWLNDKDVKITRAGSIEGYTPAHFTVTNGQGRVTKESVGSTGFIFPVGIDSGDYTPARIINDGTPDDYSVRVMQGISPAYTLAAGIDRTWDISEATSGGSDVTLSLQHNLSTNDPLYADTAAYISGSSASRAVWDSYPLSAGTGTGLLTDGAPVVGASVLTRHGLSDMTVHTRFTKFAPVAQVGLKAVKTVEPDSIYLGQEFAYHFSITNTGLLTLAPPIVIIDTLPSGAEYISASGAGFSTTISGHVVTATYSDSLYRGDSLTYDIFVRGVSDTLANVAFIHSPLIIVPTGGCDTCSPGTPVWPMVLWHELFIPDAFSPNGDGVNDHFVIPNLSHYYPQASISIYNRNGDEVWYSNGPYRDDFAGLNYDGKVLPDATYYYVLYYNDGSNRKTSHFLDMSR